MGVHPSLRKDLQLSAEITVRDGSVSFDKEEFPTDRLTVVGFFGYGLDKKNSIDFRCGFVNVAVRDCFVSVWGGEIISARQQSTEELLLHESEIVREYLRLMKRLYQRSRFPKDPFFWPILYSYKQYVAMINRAFKNKKCVPLGRSVSLAMGAKFKNEKE